MRSGTELSGSFFTLVVNTCLSVVGGGLDIFISRDSRRTEVGGRREEVL